MISARKTKVSTRIFDSLKLHHPESLEQGKGQGSNLFQVVAQIDFFSAVRAAHRYNALG
jgi:hypothetical protein